MPSRSPQNWQKVFAILSLFVGLPPLIMAIAFINPWLNDRALKERGVSTLAFLAEDQEIQREEREFDDHTMVIFRANLRFTTQRGEEISLKNEDITEQEVHLLEMGKGVPRRYLPDQPTILESPNQHLFFWGMLGFGLWGILFCFLGIKQLIKARNEEE